MKNMRVWRGEPRTCKGYISSTSSVIRTGVTSIFGLDHGIRADGTEDLLAQSDGGGWKLVGDAKTLISVGSSRGLITDVSATLVTGDSDCRFLTDYHAGDLFWMNADGIAEAKEVTSIQSNTLMTLTDAYAGATTAGAHDSWWKQTKARTQSAFWNNIWFFANGTDDLMEWDTTYFRPAGVPRPILSDSAPIAALTAAGGSLSSGTTYYYRLCMHDTASAYGLPDAGTTSAISAMATGTDLSIWLQAYDHAGGSNFNTRGYIANANPWPPWIPDIRIYRATAEAGPYYYVTATSSAVTGWLDDGSITPSTTDTLPVYHHAPGAGYEDLAVIENRLAAISGRYLYISGLPPTDIHTDTAGRNEPEYWSVSHRIGDGEETGQYSFLSMWGRTYILGSRHIHIVDVRADDPAVWGVIPFLPNYGLISRGSIGNGGDQAFWVGRRGGRVTVLGWDGMSRPKDIGAPVETILASIDTANLDQCVGGVGHGFYWCYIPGADKTIEYNIREGTWCWRDWHTQWFAGAETEVYAAFSDGLVNKLENGYSKAGSAQTYQLDGPAADLETPEYPKRFQSFQAEFDVYAGSPDVSAQYIVDEGTPAAMPDSPVALTATPEYRVHLAEAVYGQRMQPRFLSQGTDIDFALRGFVVKGQIEMRDAD